VVLSWGDVGFVRLFSTKPIKGPADFTNAKIFVWDGDPKSVDAWKAAGFKPVVLSSTDVIPSLQTGMIDTIASAPLYALTARLYQKAKYMTDLPWAVLTGATVVRKELWDKIPADQRAKVQAIAVEYGKKINDEVRKENEAAVATMKGQGMVEVKADSVADWQAAADRANQVVRGGVVPASAFDEVLKLRDEYRKSHK
jgi:TRAP-type C4-dicarboxylate transport system substrate-binding protein